MKFTDVIAALKREADPGKAAFFPRFFKAGPGEYAEGDVFIGVTVPKTRLVAKAFKDLSLSEVSKLLKDPIHEARLAALEILCWRYPKADESERKRIIDFYVTHFAYVNNWDLVDGSAPYLLGDWLLTRDRSMLRVLAKSGVLWQQRIAIVSTYAFIRAGQLDDTLEIAELLIGHSHDLIHKAVGWMLREAGKKNRKVLEEFLGKHASAMPRTMLRYALEKFDERTRKRYLAMRKARF